MKKIFICLTFLMFVFPAFGEVLIGTVNVQKVLVSIEQGKKIQQKLQAEFKKRETELKKEEKQLREKQESFQKQSLLWDDKKKASEQGKMQESLMLLQKKSMQYQQEMQDMEQKEKMPILEKIKTVIEGVSVKSNVEFTIESSTTPIVYAKKTMDLTDEVIKQYNTQHK